MNPNACWRSRCFMNTRTVGHSFGSRKTADIFVSFVSLEARAEPRRFEEYIEHRDLRSRRSARAPVGFLCAGETASLPVLSRSRRGAAYSGRPAGRAKRGSPEYAAPLRDLERT